MNHKNGAQAPGGSACLEKVEVAFREAMQSVYGQLDWLPVADGSIHRFTIPGDRQGSCNGWYVLHLGGIASGAFGSWKTGEQHTWSSRKPVDQRESLLVRQRIEQARLQREAEQRQRQQAAAEYAQRLWRDARRADPGHPYLVAKQVRPHHLRQHHDQLLIPLYHEGELVNLQRIRPDSSKRFLSGGQVKGAYSPLGSIAPGKPLYLVEGWATGATLLEHTGAAVACAMNCGNLLPVGQHLQRRRPDVDLIVASDDDRQTDGNPGRTAGIAAAIALGCQVTFPEWPEDAPPDLSDFNDLQQWLRREAR